MQINWFTAIAQILNFLILAWLLKRFLYKPILNAIDTREKRITAQLNDAEAKKAEANREREEFMQKNEQFDQEKKGLMNSAITETKEERQKLLEEARQEAIALRINLEKAMMESQESRDREIKEKTEKEVFALARKTLNDLASASVEEQAIGVFIKRLKGLSKAERKQFVDAFQTVSNPILLQSAFELAVKQQNEIKAVVAELLGMKPKFQVKIVPELITGIELSSNGYKLAWSISEYLNSLQRNHAESMPENPGTTSEK